MAELYGDETSPIVEVLIDGVWTDVSDRVRGDQRVSVSRGRANEQSRAAPQRANLTFDNPDGYFSTRMPTSVNYRKIGKNTQVRISAGRGDNHLRTLYNDIGEFPYPGASTADKASLDVTGDIDLRFDVHPHSWRGRRTMTLASKYLTIGDQRAWAVRVNGQGFLNLLWTTSGAFATAVSVTATEAVPADAGRTTVRVTLDVDNGAGGKTVTWYTGPGVDGPWTVLGSAVTSSGTTSIASTTATLTVCRVDQGLGGFANTIPFGGRFHRFQMYDGIDGTLVADFNPGARSLGDTSWSDGLAAANTWTVEGIGARVTSDRVRFWGELASLPKEWDRSGTDVTVPAKASGMLQRLGQGAKPLESAMTRNFRGTPEAFGWWPLEDAADAVRGANLAAGVNPRATIYAMSLRDASLGVADAPPGAKSCLQLGGSSGRALANIKLFDFNLTQNYVFYIKTSGLPASSKTFAILYFTFGRVEFQLSATTWTALWFDLLNNVISTSNTNITLIDPTDAWVGYNLLIEEVGADVEYSERWDTIGTFGGGVGPTTISGAAGTVEPRRILFDGGQDAAFNDLKVSQVFATTATFDLSDDVQRDASNAYAGETASARLKRLSDEEGVPFEFTGLADEAETMGYQTIKTFPDLIAECWEADGGIGGDCRDALTLEYRTRADMELRADVTLTHSSSDLSQPPRPTDDDQGFTNDVTLQRQGGSAWRAVVTEGYTSISDPPDGVGRYDSEYTLNIATDDRLPSVAGWLALAGSWDQDRYPSIEVALHRARLLADDELFRNVLALRLGDTALLAGLPAWMPPETIGQAVLGYTEQLSRFLYDIEMNCAPAGPYRAVAQLGHDVIVPRADATGHTHSNALTTTGTSLTMVTPAGSARWVDSATYPDSFPMDIVINGEVMTLTAVTGTSSPQTGTVTRSVNGVVKTHDADSLVRLAEPQYIAR